MFPPQCLGQPLQDPGHVCVDMEELILALYQHLHAVSWAHTVKEPAQLFSKLGAE